MLSPLIAASRNEATTCLANYLRDKKLLEKDVHQFEPSNLVSCQNYLIEMKTTVMRTLLEEILEPEEPHDEPIIEIIKTFRKKHLNFINDCLREQFINWDVTDRFIKYYVYEQSTGLSARQKKTFVSRSESQYISRSYIGVFVCFPDDIFGLTYHTIFDDDVETEESLVLADKENLYCLRQYAVSNQLVNSSVFNVDINRDHLEISPSINCTGRIRSVFEWFRDIARHYMQGVFFENEAPRLRHVCMNRAVENSKIENFYTRLITLRELHVADDVKHGMMIEFVEINKNIAASVLKCLKNVPKKFYPKIY